MTEQILALAKKMSKMQMTSSDNVTNRSLALSSVPSFAESKDLKESEAEKRKVREMIKNKSKEIRKKDYVKSKTVGENMDTSDHSRKSFKRKANTEDQVEDYTEQDAEESIGEEKRHANEIRKKDYVKAKTVCENTDTSDHKNLSRKSFKRKATTEDQVEDYTEQDAEESVWEEKRNAKKFKEITKHEKFQAQASTKSPKTFGKESSKEKTDKITEDHSKAVDERIGRNGKENKKKKILHFILMHHLMMMKKKKKN